MVRQSAIVCTLAAILATPAGADTRCVAESGARRVALLELYTSEGCNSCPPTDRWVSTLPQRGLGPDRVVTLGFHVDYWNYLGWNDPFARPAYSARQREASHRNKARFVYTPQLLLNGRDYRRRLFADGLADRLRALESEPPRARIRLARSPASSRAIEASATATIRDAADRRDGRLYLALYENDLANQVTTGENRGKRLRHDFVVRHLAGPYTLEVDAPVPVRHRFSLEPGWKPRDLHVAAFVQNHATGAVLQSIAAPDCPDKDTAPR